MRQKLASILFVLCNLLMTGCDAQARSWQAQSGDKQVAVLELFTAEGCGLCPAADAWVKNLPKQHDLNPDDVIVLGFHIDYLNDAKGWVDRYSKPEFTARQKQLVRLNLFDTVFTPEFIVSGEVIHGWRKHVPTVVRKLNEMPPEADINLEVAQVAQVLSINAEVSVRGSDNQQQAKLFIAVTENGIINIAGGGDNRGHTFHHENVVRAWLGPFDLDARGTSQITQEVTLEIEWKAEDLRAIAVVQNMTDSFILQAIALPLTRD